MIEDAYYELLISGYPVFSVVNDDTERWEGGKAARWRPHIGWTDVHETF